MTQQPHKKNWCWLIRFIHPNRKSGNTLSSPQRATYAIPFQKKDNSHRSKSPHKLNRKILNFLSLESYQALLDPEILKLKLVFYPFQRFFAVKNHMGGVSLIIPFLKIHFIRIKMGHAVKPPPRL